MELNYEIEIRKDGEVVAHGEVAANTVIAVLTTIMNNQAAERGEVNYVKKSPHVQQVAEPKKGKRKCGQCGKPGHIARHCPGIGVKEPAEAHESEDRLSKVAFFDIKQQRSDPEFTSRGYAEENDMPLAEVNKAVQARDYKEYLTL